MSTGRERAGSLPGLGMFCFGMSIIIAATVLNIAHDRLSGHGLESLPPFLARLFKLRQSSLEPSLILLKQRPAPLVRSRSSSNLP